MLVDGGLFDAEGIDRSVVDVPLRGQGVDSRSFEPGFGPASELASGAALERGEEVGERGVAPGMGAEVVAHAVSEAVRAEECDELLEHGRALAVGDAIEVEECGVRVGHVAGDGVRRGELVLLVGPGLHSRVERGPGAFGPAGRVFHRQVGHVGRERLVQPQIVPPTHRDEVAEPHVRHLVKDHFGAVEALNFCRRVAEDHPL